MKLVTDLAGQKSTDPTGSGSSSLHPYLHLNMGVSRTWNRESLVSRSEPPGVLSDPFVMPSGLWDLCATCGFSLNKLLFAELYIYIYPRTFLFIFI